MGFLGRVSFMSDETLQLITTILSIVICIPILYISFSICWMLCFKSVVDESKAEEDEVVDDSATICSFNDADCDFVSIHIIRSSELED